MDAALQANNLTSPTENSSSETLTTSRTPEDIGNNELEEEEEDDERPGSSTASEAFVSAPTTPMRSGGAGETTALSKDSPIWNGAGNAATDWASVAKATSVAFSSFMGGTAAARSVAVEPAPIGQTGPIAMSMSGCGFLCTYHFGSALCFRQHAPKLLSRTSRFAGASAGALVAALLAICPEKLQSSLETLYETADEVNSQRFGALTPGYSLIKRLEGIIEEALPANASELATERLFISITANNKNKLTQRYPDRQCVVKTLMASCYIPIYAGIGEKPIMLDDEVCQDGGLTDNLPKFSDVRTVTVSPFSGEAEIAPKDPGVLFDWTMKLSNQLLQVNLRNIVRGAQALFPPPRPVLETYYDMGYKHAMSFLIKNNCYEREEGSEV